MLHQAAEQSAEDILRNGPDENKCIAGRFLMAWPPSGKKMETIATISSSSTPETAKYTFRIYFELTEECLAKLQVSSHDEFRLSLKGAVMEKLSQIQKLSSLPMQLTFSDGVHIQWKNRGPNMEIKTLNTWSSSESRDVDNSWYLSDGESDDRPVPAKRRHGQSEETTYPSHSGTSNLSSGIEPSATESKRYRRMEAKRQKLAKREGNKPLADDSEPVSNQSGKPLERKDVSPLSLQSQVTESVLEFQPGLRTGSRIYSAIKDIQRGLSVSVIGIVTNMSIPTMTHKGDWACSIDIVDPSNYHLNDLGRSQALKINCFTKRYREWLPHPKIGDVIILCHVKIVEYQGSLTGTGYADKLQWAAFSSSKGEVHHGPPNNVPKQEGLADGGLGASFSPFFQPDSPVIRYCVKLSDWWREAKPNVIPTTKKLQIEEKANQSYLPISRSHRVHRLISEAGPSVPPAGYFDCTVEVLKGVPNDGFRRVYTLFVTDYTRNEHTPIFQGNWCSSSLSEYVLQLEMWDASAEAAQNMRPGHYYLIKNARMKINTAGYYEGKVAEAKITELQEAEAETNIHLKSLLERKQQLEAKPTKTESATAYQLIQDITEGKFFNCTVELLHLVNRPEHSPCLYVTDYTLNPQLTANVANSPWSRGLQKRIIKIFLSQEQRHVVDSVSIGSYYCIRKLRIRHTELEQGYCGFLGGNEKLLVPLNPNKTDNEHLNGLLRRRETYINKIKRAQHDTPKVDQLPPNPPSPARVVSKAIQPFTRIMDIREDAIPQIYQICAKVVDFHPLELREAFYQHCSRCNVEVPKKHRACTRCSDFEHDYLEYKYQLFLMLEDEDGYQIFVSVGDKCPLLAGLERGSLSENDMILRKFCDRLQPMLGNLAAMHEGLKSEENVPVDTPYLCFEVGSWSVPDARPAYRLIKYEKLPLP
ncbi:hypothetical protein M413DRAFT_21140 [Hebeloma cylindrosporum]|uniref:Protection of telomeres protein 1 n=1 Tax=Hebeloma cylindrosporum TaxID=76867 RepID=A0A0C3CJD9_HEBCY|nr:hypothetical protein M413DRAFT_21140 [Hebeloma cylindrosporum h7]